MTHLTFRGLQEMLSDSRAQLRTAWAEGYTALGITGLLQGLFFLNSIGEDPKVSQLQSVVILMASQL